jgi:hypothetical protein
MTGSPALFSPPPPPVCLSALSDLEEDGKGDSEADEEGNVREDEGEEAGPYLEEDVRGAAHQRVNRHHREAVEPQQQRAQPRVLTIKN